MKDLVKNIIGYISLRKEIEPLRMGVFIYASLLAYRKVTDGPSPNPLTYMFSTKEFLTISTRYGFSLFNQLHLKDNHKTIMGFSDRIVTSTYSIHQQTMMGDTKQIEKILAFIAEIHADIDTFMATMPKSFEKEVNRISYRIMENSSLTKRMERLMDKQDV